MYQLIKELTIHNIITRTIVNQETVFKDLQAAKDSLWHHLKDGDSLTLNTSLVKSQNTKEANEIIDDIVNNLKPYICGPEGSLRRYEITISAYTSDIPYAEKWIIQELDIV